MSITSKRAAEVLGMAVTFNGCGRSNRNEMEDAVRAGIAALHEKADREDPKPLTLEELRQCEGCPVFLVIENINVKRWAIIDFSGDERTRFQNGLRLSNEVYGMTWFAYRHKPKEG
jgi:hypothetical protein